MIRTVLAFVIAPIAPALPILVFFLVMAFSSPSEGIPATLGAFLFFIAPVAYPVAIGAGLPLYLLLRKNQDLQKKRFYAFFGAVLGLVEFFILTRMGSSSSDYNSLYESGVVSVFFVLCGVASALVFWLIAKPYRSLNAEA